MNFVSVDGRFTQEKQGALEGQGTHHCVSGSLKRLYASAGIRISEDLLLGLGEGVGFIYWHAKGSVPFLGGRAQPKEGMEGIAARRTGVTLTTNASSSPARARATLIASLKAGQPVMLQADMGFLPYFDFAGSGYHFGGHVILACAYDEARDLVLVADREKEFYELPMEDLVKARSSTFKPFPPGNRAWTGDFSGFHEPDPADMVLALANQARGMVSPPIANLGCRGISKAGGKVEGWPAAMDEAALRETLFNLWIFASPQGGSGGGLFRHMLSRYVDLCAKACRQDRFARAADAFRQTALVWDRIGDQAKALSAGSPADLAPGCRELGSQLRILAGMELEAWSACL